MREAKAAEAEAALRVQELAGGAGVVAPGAEFAHRSPTSSSNWPQASAQAASAGAAAGHRHPQLMAYRRQQAELRPGSRAETAQVADAARRNLEAAHARVAAATRTS